MKSLAALLRRSGLYPLYATGVLLAAAMTCPAASAQDATAIAAKAQPCIACHGDKGIPVVDTIPNIWGQHEGYLYLQMRDFKSGSRANETMHAMVANLEKSDLKALAAYFAALPWPELQQPVAADAVADKALTLNGSVGCTGCHLANYQGDSTVARLAGQNRAYLFNSMKAFRDRSRGNNPGMSDLMHVSPIEDLDAMAEYLAGMHLNR